MATLAQLHGPLLLALLLGAGYGYVAQRGAFCMNSGVRFLYTRRDATKLKAYGLALALQMLAVPLLLRGHDPSLPSFVPAGALLGGFLFGLSMPVAAGCAAGVWYKLGAGSGAALFATLGMATGATLFELGPAAGLRAQVQALGGSLGFAHVPADTLRWCAPLLGLVLGALLWRTRDGVAGDYSWRRTGLLIGALGVLAWPLSRLAGRDFGMAIVPGTVHLVTLTGIGDANLDGASRINWDLMFVVGIPLGAAIAAHRPARAARTSSDGNGSSATRPPWKLQLAPARQLLTRFVGGLGLGAGASLAAGCTVGHGLTGIPLLAPGSLVTTAAIFAGASLPAIIAMRREAG